MATRLMLLAIKRLLEFFRFSASLVHGCMRQVVTEPGRRMTTGCVCLIAIKTKIPTAS